jgi:cytochrome c5
MPGIGNPARLAGGLPISSVHTPRPATRRVRGRSGGTGPGADHIIVRSASGGLPREDDTVTADQDRKFFDMFMIVLGSLVGIAVAIYALAQAVQAESQAEARRQDPIVQAQIEARIRPVGQVAIAGQDNSALDGPGGMGSGTETAAAAAAPAQALSGEEVYNLACAACHAAGVAGAPKFAEAAAWSARIEQGVDTLVSHAINGYSGSAGYMPPKGGRTDLSDDAVRASVEYMVAAAQ